MDSGDIYAARPATGSPTPPPTSDPANRQAETSLGGQAADPFAQPSRAQRAARGTRGRIGGARAAAGARRAKLSGAVKGPDLLLPQLQVLPAAGPALRSVALFPL